MRRLSPMEVDICSRAWALLPLTPEHTNSNQPVAHVANRVVPLTRGHRASGTPTLR
jgi:hypothetical protein